MGKWILSNCCRCNPIVSGWGSANKRREDGGANELPVPMRMPVHAKILRRRVGIGERNAAVEGEIIWSRFIPGYIEW